MGSSDDRRAGTLAMRISKNEHDRLRALAVTYGLGEAELVRHAVDEFAKSRGDGLIFAVEKG